jgi:hypothetical protein
MEQKSEMSAAFHPSYRRELCYSLQNFIFGKITFLRLSEIKTVWVSTRTSPGTQRSCIMGKQTNSLAFSPQANYTD